MIDMTENDFGVLMRPIMEEDGDWDGNIQISVFSNLMPKIDDEVHAHLMFLAYKMSAMVQYCTDNPDFDDTLNDYTEDLLDEYDPTRPEGHSVKSKGVITSREGNVITLDFNTKCEGEG